MKTFFKNAKVILPIFLVSRIFFLIIMFIEDPTMINVWGYFDNEWYREIAKNGYTNEMQTAFFPVIPILIHFFGNIGIVLINNIITIFTMFLIDNLLQENNNKTICLLIFALSPIGFFTVIGYTEAIFLFLTILAYYLFTKRKFGYILGIVIGLSVATRNLSSMLFFSIFIGMCYLWWKKKISIKEIVTTYIPATIISCLYPIFLQIKFGNWKIFIDCQKEYWGRTYLNPLELIKTQFKIIYTNDITSIIWFKINDIVTIILFIFIAYIVVKELNSQLKEKKFSLNRMVMVLYVILSMLCIYSSNKHPLLDSPTASAYRYFLGMFPLYLLIQNMNYKHKKILFMIIVLFSITTTSLFCLDSYFY